MKYLSILSLVFLIGCAVTRSTEVTTTGENIKTVYGTGTVNAIYRANTTYEFLNGRD